MYSPFTNPFAQPLQPDLASFAERPPTDPLLELPPVNVDTPDNIDEQTRHSRSPRSRDHDGSHAGQQLPSIRTVRVQRDRESRFLVAD
jgi:hypothetical protein